ncbi:hypothetical protein [Aquipuribacter nitratireducens]|uniref:RNA polymerase sigma factor n=1 Tax=Aquipuribacter nitratireducens TaxID=650104 RepID=A0ABW0GJ94_9MICO
MHDEGVTYEGLRLGSSRAFADVLRDDGPVMRRVAALYVGPGEVDTLVRHTWSVALPGLDMFTWHTSLRAWLTGILVTQGRARAGRDNTCGIDDAPAPRDRPAPGPVPWATLPWSAHWGDDGWVVVRRTLVAQPLAVREVLWLHDVEGWPWRDVLDALGLTEEDGSRLLDDGRSALATAVARHLGADGSDGSRRERLEAVAALLRWLRSDTADPPAPDPALGRTFAAWRRRRAVPVWRRWRWEHGRVRDGARVTAAGR